MGAKLAPNTCTGIFGAVLGSKRPTAFGVPDFFKLVEIPGRSEPGDPLKFRGAIWDQKKTKINLKSNF